jgi:hypothetical protein
MEPDGTGLARCPLCGRLDVAVVAPVFLVTGASGSGKTTLFPLVAQRLTGRATTFDVDWLLDAAGGLSRGEPIDWPSFRAAWLAVAHGVAQTGMPTVLLGPFMPEQLDELPSRQWIGDIHWLVLDCSDDTRRRRIEQRPIWRARDVDEQTKFGQWLRANIDDRIDTEDLRPEQTADAVAQWVIDRLG